MKILSTTENDGRVVELEREEFRQLYLLMRSCDPDVVDERFAMWDSGVDTKDGYAKQIDLFNFTSLFSLIRAWRESRFALNTLKKLIAGIEKALMESDD